MKINKKSTSFKFKFDSISIQHQNEDDYLISGYTVDAPDDRYDGMPTGVLTMYAVISDAVDLLPDTIKGSTLWYKKEYARVRDEQRQREQELEDSGVDYDYQKEIDDVFKESIWQLCGCYHRLSL